MVFHKLQSSLRQSQLTASGESAVLDFGTAPYSTKAQQQPKCFSFGTKAATLASIQSLVQTASVPDLLYFRVAKWNADAAEVLLEIDRRFDGKSVVFRSSAQNEDGDRHSQAGTFKSCLGVDSGDPQAVQGAVQSVVDSFEGDPEDQVLVMPMLKDLSLIHI